MIPNPNPHAHDLFFSSANLFANASNASSSSFLPVVVVVGAGAASPGEGGGAGKFVVMMTVLAAAGGSTGGVWGKGVSAAGWGAFEGEVDEASSVVEDGVVGS